MCVIYVSIVGTLKRQFALEGHSLPSTPPTSSPAGKQQNLTALVMHALVKVYVVTKLVTKVVTSELHVTVTSYKQVTSTYQVLRLEAVL